MKSKTLIERIISNPVIQTLVIYVSGAWVIIELVEYFIEHLNLNEQVRIVLLIFMLCGMPIAVFFAWYVSGEKVNKLPVGMKTRGRFARWLRRPRFFLPGIVLILLIIGAGINYFNRKAKIRWASEKAIPEIEQFVDEFNISAAFQLVLKAEKYISDNPKFKELSSLVSTKFTILTDPPGADIFVKEYADMEGDWRFLGITPMDSIKMPTYSFYRWKIEKPGYETVLAAAPTGFPDYNDTLVTFERSHSLISNKYGLSIKTGSDLVERKNSGWCGTPPIHYADFDGSWMVHDSIIYISVGYWGGLAEYEWKIVSLNPDYLTIKRIEERYQH